MVNLKDSHEDKMTKLKKLENFNPKKSYIGACLFNNDELIQAHLLSCKNDHEIVEMLNEKDIYGRKGINYLIIYSNLDMIKLNLMGGLILGDTIDNFNRNIIHYCSLLDCIDIIEVIIRCIIFEYKEQQEEMKLYLEKVFLKRNEKIKNYSKELNLSKQEALKTLNFLEDTLLDKNLNYQNNHFKEDEEGKGNL